MNGLTKKIIALKEDNEGTGVVESYAGNNGGANNSVRAEAPCGTDGVAPNATDSFTTTGTHGHQPTTTDGAPITETPSAAGGAQVPTDHRVTIAEAKANFRSRLEEMVVPTADLVGVDLATAIARNSDAKMKLLRSMRVFFECMHQTDTVPKSVSDLLGIPADRLRSSKPWNFPLITFFAWVPKNIRKILGGKHKKQPLSGMAKNLNVNRGALKGMMQSVPSMLWPSKEAKAWMMANTAFMLTVTIKDHAENYTKLALRNLLGGRNFTDLSLLEMEALSEVLYEASWDAELAAAAQTASTTPEGGEAGEFVERMSFADAREQSYDGFVHLFEQVRDKQGGMHGMVSMFEKMFAKAARNKEPYGRIALTVHAMLVTLCSPKGLAKVQQTDRLKPQTPEGAQQVYEALASALIQKIEVPQSEQTSTGKKEQPASSSAAQASSSHEGASDSQAAGGAEPSRSELVIDMVLPAMRAVLMPYVLEGRLPENGPT